MKTEKELEDDIRTDPRETGCEDGRWKEVVQNYVE
jgi:hypothetical protein